LEADTAGLRAKRRITPRKVPIAALPEDQRPRQLALLAKMLTDTVKMIAYRAETALVGLLRPQLPIVKSVWTDDVGFPLPMGHKLGRDAIARLRDSS